MPTGCLAIGHMTADLTPQVTRRPDATIIARPWFEGAPTAQEARAALKLPGPS